MWDDNSFSQRNKATKRAGEGGIGVCAFRGWSQFKKGRGQAIWGESLQNRGVKNPLATMKPGASKLLVLKLINCGQ